MGALASEWMEVAEAAELLEVTRHQVRRLVRLGRLRAERVAGRLVVAREDVGRYVRQRGPWPVYGVYGGLAAARRLGVVE